MIVKEVTYRILEKASQEMKGGENVTVRFTMAEEGTVEHYKFLVFIDSKIPECNRDLVVFEKLSRATHNQHKLNGWKIWNVRMLSGTDSSLAGSIVTYIQDNDS
ncbi:hypothetical protein ACFL2D_00055 [Patescibacteria group bacterium]